MTNPTDLLPVGSAPRQGVYILDPATGLAVSMVPASSPAPAPAPSGPSEVVAPTLLAPLTALAAHPAGLTAAELASTAITTRTPGDWQTPAPADATHPSAWDLSGVRAADIVRTEATAGQRVLSLTIDPTAPGGAASWLIASHPAASPATIDAGLTITQRTRTDRAALAVVDPLTTMPQQQPVQIASAQQSATTLTVNLAAPYPGEIGDVVSLRGLPDNRLWYQFAPIAGISGDRLAITITHADAFALPSLNVGPVTGGQMVPEPDPLAGCANGAAVVYSSTSGNYAELLARKHGTTRTASAVTSAASDRRSYTNTSWASRTSWATGERIAASTQTRIEIEPGTVAFLDRGIDAATTWSLRGAVQSTAPGVDRIYSPAVGVIDAPAKTRPVAKVVSISRASNVATITLDRTAAAAEILPGQYLQIAGVRDTTLFPASMFSAPVATVSGSTITIPWTGAAGASAGGMLAIPAGGVGVPGLYGNSVQSVSVGADGLVTITATTAWSAQNADPIWLSGVRNASTGADLGIDGPWVINRVGVITTQLVLEPLFDHAGQRRSPAPPAMPATNCGGALIIATTVRIHSLLTTSRGATEVRLWGQGSSSPLHAVPIAGSLSVVQSSPLAGTGGTLGWPVAQGLTQSADAPSATITASTTSGGITGMAGNSGGACAFVLVFGVTAITAGTALDIRVEVQDDNARWYPLYDLHRITAVGAYSTPELRTDARAYRVVRTLSGVTPSVTMGWVRNLLPFQPARHLAQMIDRTLPLTTLGSATPALYCDGPSDLHLHVNCSATATPPVIALQASEDGGATWTELGALTCVSGQTARLALPSVYPRHARAVVKTAAAAGATGWVLVKGVG